MGDTVRLFTKVFEPNDAHPHGGYVPTGPLNPLPVAGTVTSQTTPRTPVATGALADHLSLKGTAGTLYSANVGTGATPGWLMIFDAAAPPADGAVTPVKAYQVAANSSFDRTFNPPLAFANGIQLVFSSTGPFTKTASATAFLSGEFS